MFKKLSSHVDTFKEALYLNGDFDKYNSFVDDLIIIKEQAQQIHDMNNDNRFIDFMISGHRWQIMATSIKGYSVVMKNGDVSIAFRKKGNILKDKNPNIKIEYRAQFLVNYGLKGAHKQVNDFIKQNIHNDYLSKTQEIHLACDTQGHTFNLFDIYRMKTRARSCNAYDGDDGEIGRKMVFTSRRLETLYFGTGSNMLRIYNKTAEEKKHPDSAHIKKLWALSNSGYDDTKDVWRIEFQIRREKLKGIFNANKEPYDYTTVLLDNLSGLWDFFITYFSYKDISQDTAIDLIKGYYTKKKGSIKLFTKEAERKIFQRSEIHPLWEKIRLYNNDAPPYYFRFAQVKESQPTYAMNSVCSLISTITKHYGTITPEILNKVVMEAEQRSLKNNDMGIIDKSFSKLLDYFAKVEKQTKLGLDIIETPQDFNDNFSFFVWDALSPLKFSSQYVNNQRKEKMLHESDFSKHFSFLELTDSTKHKDLVTENRRYALRFIENGSALSYLLDSIKMQVFLGDIMDTSSCCRSIILNTATGGYDKIVNGVRVLSSHTRFVAWDGKPRKYSVDLAFKMIMTAWKKGKLPTLAKVIIEKIGGKEWLHIQVKERVDQSVLFLSTSDGVNYKTILKG